MGKLTMQRAVLQTLRPSVAYMPEGEKERDKLRASLPWRQWYNTKRWRDLRERVMQRDRFKCNLCKRIEPRSSQLVGDHRRPHKGDERLFWDESNVWLVCKPCHDSAKQKTERRGAVES
jgi:5-methylcytosine-specific restriction endonuclease McrA